MEFAVSLDFRYDVPDGDTLTSDTYRRAVTVVAPTDDGGGLPLVPILVVVVLVLGAGWYYRTRR